jgi:hypothetical protein
MCGSIFNPLLFLWSPGGLELTIILIIVLLMLGGIRTPDIARGMGEARVGKARERRPQRADTRYVWLLVLALFAGVVALCALTLSGFSDEQKLVAAGVLLCWVGVGYWSFGRK